MFWMSMSMCCVSPLFPSIFIRLSGKLFPQFWKLTFIVACSLCFIFPNQVFFIQLLCIDACLYNSNYQNADFRLFCYPIIFSLSKWVFFFANLTFYCFSFNWFPLLVARFQRRYVSAVLIVCLSFCQFVFLSFCFSFFLPFCLSHSTILRLSDSQQDIRECPKNNCSQT
jgi:hypothetical protein